MTITMEDLLTFITQKLRCKALSADAAMGKTQGWDSMAQVELILSLEERKYGVQVPPDMFGELSSASAILGFLNSGGRCVIGRTTLLHDARGGVGRRRARRARRG